MCITTSSVTRIAIICSAIYKKIKIKRQKTVVGRVSSDYEEVEVLTRILMQDQHWQGCRSSLSIGEDSLQFHPNFALFSTLGDEPQPPLFSGISKLSEDQKKRSSPKLKTFFHEFK